MLIIMNQTFQRYPLEGIIKNFNKENWNITQEDGYFKLIEKE